MLWIPRVFGIHSGSEGLSNFGGRRLCRFSFDPSLVFPKGFIFKASCMVFLAFTFLKAPIDIDGLDSFGLFDESKHNHENHARSGGT
jgi:hypothetical protein